MLKVFRDANIARIRQRVSEGDCPITAPLSIEMLENIVIDLADEASILATRPAETLASLSSESLADDLGERPDLNDPDFEKRLRQAYCVQQKSVPDQAAIVWRGDLLQLFHQYYRLQGIASTPSPSDVIEKCARAMAEHAELDWDDLPAEYDAACGYGMPEGCKAYWIGLSRVALASKEGQHHGQG